jgi:hypothetical protein
VYICLVSKHVRIDFVYDVRCVSAVMMAKIFWISLWKSGLKSELNIGVRLGLASTSGQQIVIVFCMRIIRCNTTGYSRVRVRVSIYF